MASRTSQRTVYLVTAAIVASMITGFTVAAFSLGGTNNSYQGSQTTTVTALPGLTWLSTNLSEVQTGLNFTTPACGTTVGSACGVSSTWAVLCVGSFNSSLCDPSDFVEQVTLTTVAGVAFYAVAPPITVAVTVFVTGTPHGGSSVGTYAGSTFYLKESSTPATAQLIVLYFDIGATPTGPGAVNSVSVIITAQT